MDFLEILHKRRSIREFTDEQVARPEVEKIVEAGRIAPTAMNRQKLRFTVLRNREAVEKLRAAIGKALDMADYAGFYGARTLIVVTAPKDLRNSYFDTGCAMQNMMLAASSLGVASCWINQLKTTSDDPQVRKCLNEFQVPEDHKGMAMLALGVPTQDIYFEREKKSEVIWIE